MHTLKKSKKLLVTVLLVMVLSTVLLGCQQQAKKWRFHWPQRLVTDAKGNVYIVDTIINHTKEAGDPDRHVKDVILKVAPSGHLIELFDLGKRSVADLAVSPRGNIYFYGYHGNSDILAKIEPGSKKITKLPVPRIKGRIPRGLAVDNNDNIYLAFDWDFVSPDKTGRIVKLSGNGRLLAAWKPSHRFLIGDLSLPYIKFITSNNANSIYVSLYVGPGTHGSQSFERFTPAGKGVLLPLRIQDWAISFAVDKNANFYVPSAGGPAKQVTPQGTVTGQFGSQKLSPTSIAVAGQHLFILVDATDVDQHINKYVYKHSLGGKLLSKWQGVSAGGPMAAN